MKHNVYILLHACSATVRLLHSWAGTSHILVFGCLHDQDVVGSEEKVAEKIPGTKITRYYLRRHLHRVTGSRRHLCPKSPETFESKLRLFWLKEP